MINNITKNYKKNIVFNDLSIDFKDNCSLIIGQNGSGKTTLLKIIAGLIKNYQGTTDLDNDVSIMLDIDCVFLNKTGYENLEYFLTLDELITSKKYIQIFEMKSYLNQKVKKYSNGMKKKLMLVVALSKDNSLLLLDEPTNALDINSIGLLKKILIEIKNDKKIIIASHNPLIYDNDLIDSVYIIKDNNIVKTNKTNFDYEIVKIKTLNKIEDNKIFDCIYKNNTNYYFKVKRSDLNEFAIFVNKYIVTCFYIINHLDDLYIKEFYNEKNN